MELALVVFEVQSLLRYGCWDLFDVVLVFLEVVGIDEDVVRISGCEVVQLRCQGIVNKILERRGCV